MSGNPSALLPPEEHVLSTLESDGSRRWLHPRLAKGRLWQRRRIVAYTLVLIYSGLPWIKIDGAPAFLLDLPSRKFVLFGATFLPTDTVLLALTVLIGFLSIFFVTAIFGRVWCGWACPQTVYMEFLFRPIERLLTGRAGVGGAPRKSIAGWRKLAMYAIYLVLALHLAQTFIAYFVGVDAVRHWMWSSPAAHVAPFLIVIALTVLMMIDFAYWREQLCIIGCPYGRFQSVLLDRNSKIVTYVPGRGEPRAPMHKSQSAEDRAKAGLGSCVDCKMCVHVCPTGIDIRNGLQLECVNCTQCIDACDAIMDATHQPRGLVRFSSQAAVEGEPTRVLRPRIAIYGALILGLSVLLATLVSDRPAADVTLMRSLGRPFIALEGGMVENTMRVKLTNRTEAPRTYTFSATTAQGLTLDAHTQGAQVVLEPGKTFTEPLHVIAPQSAFVHGRIDATLNVTDDQGWSAAKPCILLGPTGATQ
ncbi:MAG: cytochrome c oxidase accessory protein CcoG [Planctomycetota bacterium]